MTEDINWFVQKMTAREVENNLEQLLKMGADSAVCIDRMRERGIAAKAEVLEAAGVDRKTLYRRSGGRVLLNPLELVDGETPSQKELKELLKRSSKKTVIRFAVELYDAGAVLALIHKYGGARAIGEHIPEFLKRGESTGKLIRLSDYKSLMRYEDQLRASGADVELLAHEIFMRSELTLSPGLARALGCDEEGVAFMLLSSMDGDAVSDLFDELLELGYAARDLVRKLDSSQLADRIVQLLELGVDPKWVVKKLDPVDLLACAIPLGCTA